MSKRWAVVKNGMVENKIIADDSFISIIRGDYDYCVDLTDFTVDPNKRSIYYPGSNSFGPPVEDTTDLEVDVTLDYLTTGTDQTFDPFMLPDSHFEVSITPDQHWIDVGCKRYRAIWLRHAFYQMLNMNETEVGPFKVLSAGDLQSGKYPASPEELAIIKGALENILFVVQETFAISMNDSNILLSALSNIKFVTPY